MTIGKFNLLAFSLLSSSNENASVFSSRENFLYDIMGAHFNFAQMFSFRVSGKKML